MRPLPQPPATWGHAAPIADAAQPPGASPPPDARIVAAQGVGTTVAAPHAAPAPAVETVAAPNALVPITESAVAGASNSAFAAAASDAPAAETALVAVADGQTIEPNAPVPQSLRNVFKRSIGMVYDWDVSDEEDDAPSPTEPYIRSQSATEPYRRPASSNMPDVSFWGGQDT